MITKNDFLKLLKKHEKGLAGKLVGDLIDTNRAKRPPAK